MSIEKKITYFPHSGKENSQELFQLIDKRLEEGDLTTLVIASTSGNTAVELHHMVKNKVENFVVVTLHAGFRGDDSIYLKESNRNYFTKNKIPVFVGSHSLSGVGRSITNTFGGVTPVEMIGQTLKMFGGHGIKVCVEIAVMVADAGLVKTSEDILAVGGTHGGADTAIVLQPAHMNDFFSMQIKEIMAKPLSKD